MAAPDAAKAKVRKSRASLRRLVHLFAGRIEVGPGGEAADGPIRWTSARSGKGSNLEKAPRAVGTPGAVGLGEFEPGLEATVMTGRLVRAWVVVMAATGLAWAEDFRSKGDLPKEMTSAIERAKKDGQSILAVAFSDMGGWVVATSGGIWGGGPRPDGMNIAVERLKAQGQKITVVGFNDHGGWVVGTAAGIRGGGPRPVGMNQEIERLVGQHKPVTVVSFNNKGGWVVGRAGGIKGSEPRPNDMKPEIMKLQGEGKAITVVGFNDAGIWIVGSK